MEKGWRRGAAKPFWDMPRACGFVRVADGPLLACGRDGNEFQSCSIDVRGSDE
jgi:hypothetical protein